MLAKEHNSVTKYAVNILDKWKQEIIAPEVNNLINEYCTYPDSYFDVNNGGHKKASRYYFETDGIQFHYIPDTQIIDKYRYWNVNDGKLFAGGESENLNWKHAKNGFTYYLSRAVEFIKKNKLKDALAYTGCLLHMLQDSCFGLHSLEGPYGTDLFVLDRLFEYGDDISELPSNILVQEMPESAVICPEYVPLLLGNTIEEAVFMLYSRYVECCLKSRKISFKIVLNHYERKSNKDLYTEMFHGIVELSADVINTILHIAHDKKEHLSNVLLSELEPIDRPWGLGFYRFVTLLKNKALNYEKKLVPLKLIVKNSEMKFKKGMSFGSHSEFKFIYDLPENTYEKFTCYIGIQTEFLNEGNVRIKFINNGNIVFDEIFNKENPSSKVLINNPKKYFEIIGSSPENTRLKTVITLGNPQFIHLE